MGAIALARRLVFTFHGLGQPPDWVPISEHAVWVPVDWLEAILDVLPSHGVSLAFDDGNASDVREALPALMSRKVTARFFPVAGRLGSPGYLDGEDILRLRMAGMTIGSHGMHHCDWRALGDAELHDELASSRRMLASVIGAEVTEAACPFGSYDRRVLRALRATGYRRVFTSDGGAHRDGSWLSARTTVDRGRPLHHWLTLARTGARLRTRPTYVGKRFLKRIR